MLITALPIVPAREAEAVHPAVIAFGAVSMICPGVILGATIVATVIVVADADDDDCDCADTRTQGGTLTSSGSQGSGDGPASVPSEPDAGAISGRATDGPVFFSRSGRVTGTTAQVAEVARR